MAGSSGSAGATTRGLSLESHRGLEAGLGLVLLLVPFALRYGLEEGLDFSGAGIVVCAAIGLAAATLGFAGTRFDTDPSGRSHATFDRVLVGALVIGTLVFAVRGEVGTTLTLLAGTVAYVALLLSTRYTGRG